MLNRLRHPAHVLQNFAFTGARTAAPLVPLNPQGEKHATLKLDTLPFFFSFKIKYLLK